MDRFARVRLPYRIPWKNWAGRLCEKPDDPGSESELATGVSAERKTFLEAEYRYVYAPSPTIALAHKTSHMAPAAHALFLSATGAAGRSRSADCVL